jgi:hypothetical protein
MSGAANDLNQFLGNARLPNLVCVERKTFDHLCGVVRRRFHRRHSRSLLRGGRFEKRPVDLSLDMPGKQIREYFGGRLIVKIFEASGVIL